MAVIEKLDQYGRGAWIALIVAGFMIFWPLGMIALTFVVFSGRARGWRGCRSRGTWYNMEQRGSSFFRGGMPSSGNKVFDEYREETIKRLEEEQKEFVEYLEKLRQAKDKTEFDQFMADRRRPSEVQA